MNRNIKSGLVAICLIILFSTAIVAGPSVSDDDSAIGDSTVTGLDNGATYTNFGAAGDDSLNEMFAAIDTGIGNQMTAAEFTTAIGSAYDTSAELDALFLAKEDNLSNEAGLYAALSDVSDFVQPDEKFSGGVTVQSMVAGDPTPDVSNAALGTNNFYDFVPVSGTHDTGENVATLVDSGESWTEDVLIGSVITNTTNGETCTITDNDATSITCTLSGGEDWDVGDTFTVATIITDFDDGDDHSKRRGCLCHFIKEV